MLVTRKLLAGYYHIRVLTVIMSHLRARVNLLASVARASATLPVSCAACKAFVYTFPIILSLDG